MAKPLKEKVKIFEVAISLQEISPINILAKVQHMTCTRSSLLGFSGGSVVNNLPEEDRFGPWSGKIPHMVEQLSPRTTPTEPVFYGPGATTTSAPVPGAHALQQGEPLQWGAHALQLDSTTQLEKSLSATKTQDSQNKWIKLFLQKIMMV